MDCIDAETEAVSAGVHSLRLVGFGWVGLDRASVFVELVRVGFNVVFQELMVFWGGVDVESRKDAFADELVIVEVALFVDLFVRILD